MKLEIHASVIAVLHSKQEWIDKVPMCLPPKRRAEVRIWLDRFGQCLSIGEDFMVAEEIESYPVTVYSLHRVAEVEKERQDEVRRAEAMFPMEDRSKEIRQRIETGFIMEQSYFHESGTEHFQLISLSDDDDFPISQEEWEWIKGDFEYRSETKEHPVVTRVTYFFKPMEAQVSE